MIRKVLLLVLLGTSALADPIRPSPVGLWRTQDGDGVLSVERCGDELCVRIVGSANAAMSRDWRGESQCGLLISRVTEKDPGAWEGTITDPRNGNVYDVRILPEGNDRLRLRGFVLVPLLGSTQVWTRYTGHVTADCRMAG